VGDVKIVCKILFGKSEGKRQLERTGHRWKNDFKIYLKEIDFVNVEWIHSTQESMYGGVLLTL
jgi:hypothetical protein